MLALLLMSFIKFGRKSKLLWPELDVLPSDTQWCSPENKRLHYFSFVHLSTLTVYLFQYVPCFLLFWHYLSFISLVSSWAGLAHSPED